MKKNARAGKMKPMLHLMLTAALLLPTPVFAADEPGAGASQASGASGAQPSAGASQASDASGIRSSAGVPATGVAGGVQPASGASQASGASGAQPSAGVPATGVAGGVQPASGASQASGASGAQPSAGVPATGVAGGVQPSAGVSTTGVVADAPTAPAGLSPTTPSTTTGAVQPASAVPADQTAPPPAVFPATARARRAIASPAGAENADVPVRSASLQSVEPQEPRFRIGAWGGWAGTRLGLASRYVEVRMQDTYLSATMHLTDTITGSNPVTSKYDRAGGGLGYGAEIGACVLRGVMVESSGGKPRDVWLGVRYALMRPGDTTAKVSGYDAVGEGVTYNGSVSASLETVLFGGWIQGGNVADGLHGRVSVFAGPAWGRARIHEDAKFNLLAPGNVLTDKYDYTRELRGESWAFDTGLEVGYAITRSIAIFIEGGYHWARFVSMRDQNDFDFDGDGIDDHFGGEFALRGDGKRFVIDFDGFSVGAGVKFNFGWRTAVERRRR